MAVLKRPGTARQLKNLGAVKDLPATKRRPTVDFRPQLCV